MGLAAQLLVLLRRLALLLSCLCLIGAGRQPVAEASHSVYREYQSYRAAPAEDRSQARTAYHFQPRRNWINDPNAPMYYMGFYHLFYQYNPKGAVWGNIVWAHSVSKDLIHWKPLPTAIYPSKPFDINGCWSGSATILPGNKPAILYTGVDGHNEQVQNIAFPKNLSDPYLTEWHKPDYNPVIPPTAGVNASAFRDPTTGWKGRDGFWRVVVGSKVGRTGVALLYRSGDFLRWAKAAAPLHSAAGTGMWECPDFFSVSAGGVTKHALKVSLDVTRYEYYTLGKYSPAVDQYVPDGTSPDDGTGLRYDYGNFYASKTFFDPAKGRRVLWGWSNESDSVASDVRKGWAGIQTIPRAVWLDAGGKQLVQSPVPEVENLRTKEVEANNISLAEGSRFEVRGILASQADVEVTFAVSGLGTAEPLDDSSSTDPQSLCARKGADVAGGVGPFGLWVFASADLTERTAVFFRVFRERGRGGLVVLMCHDASKSTTQSGVWKPSFAGFVDVDIQKEGMIALRSLIDTSVVESFAAGGKTCITSRIYPNKAVGGDAHLFAFNNGKAAVTVSRLKAWQMAAANMN